MSEEKTFTFRDFLENVPPYQQVIIDDDHFNYYVDSVRFNPEPITIHCKSDHCNGIRIFKSKALIEAFQNPQFHQIRYICANCGSSYKVYSIQIVFSRERLTVMKIGEFPQFGPPTPNRFLRILGDEKEAFLKGRQCENQGLGVAAYAYYRQVVENKRDYLLEKTITVAEQIGAELDVIEQLQAAKDEHSFKKSVERIKDVFPDSLKIRRILIILLL